MDDVDLTLRRWRTTPFVWGDADCMLSIGDYIASRGGTDVTGLFRGTYDDEAGAFAHVAAYGGPAGLVDLTGLPETDDVQRGDVVVVDTGDMQIGALCTGDRVAMRLERGVVEVPIRFLMIVKAWTWAK